MKYGTVELAENFLACHIKKGRKKAKTEYHWVLIVLESHWADSGSLSRFCRLALEIESRDRGDERTRLYTSQLRVALAYSPPVSTHLLSRLRVYRPSLPLSVLSNQKFIFLSLIYFLVIFFIFNRCFCSTPILFVSFPFFSHRQILILFFRFLRSFFLSLVFRFFAEFHFLAFAYFLLFFYTLLLHISCIWYHVITWAYAVWSIDWLIDWL